jgi:hypothetical protein
LPISAGGEVDGDLSVKSRHAMVLMQREYLAVASHSHRGFSPVARGIFYFPAGFSPGHGNY